ncbi:MAG: hypothetical protein ACK55I_49875, partial [bacterium]
LSYGYAFLRVRIRTEYCHWNLHVRLGRLHQCLKPLTGHGVRDALLHDVTNVIQSTPGGGRSQSCPP